MLQDAFLVMYQAGMSEEIKGCSVLPTEPTSCTVLVTNLQVFPPGTEFTIRVYAVSDEVHSNSSDPFTVVTREFPGCSYSYIQTVNTGYKVCKISCGRM